VNIRALSIDRESGLLVPVAAAIGDLQDNEVLVSVTHCGLCRSDLTRVRSANQGSVGLEIPGHEIVGEIVRVGAGVVAQRVGARVGIGWQAGCCGRCEWCSQGLEHLCLAQEETCIGRPGGFATHIKVQSRFAIPVPGELDSAQVAPLMCAGITVFSPIARHAARGGRRAAVVGIGGLGHLALQFLRAFGFRADAFSLSRSKEADARAFGAEGFICLQDRSAVERISSVYDFILSTSPGLSEVTGLIRMLRPRGVLCLVGLPRERIAFAAEELIGLQKVIEGSPIGSPDAISDMFQFAVKHGVRPRVESFPMTQANKALARLAADEIRYRAVIVQNLGRRPSFR
jgi:uncharacterized zinc-type alcohol dehydrogenase-like protein